MQRLQGVTLEHHLEKTLTYLAFFDGSPAHKAYLEEFGFWISYHSCPETRAVPAQERSKRQAEGKVAENPGEASCHSSDALSLLAFLVQRLLLVVLLELNIGST